MQDVQSLRFIELLADEVTQSRMHSVLRIEHHDALDVVDFLLLSKLLYQPLKKALLIRLRLSLSQALPGNEFIFQLSLNKVR